MIGEVIIGTAANGLLRVLAVDSTRIVAALQRIHNSTAAATAALGRSLSITALIGAMLPEGNRVVSKFIGSGPIGIIVVDAYATGGIRGYMEFPVVPTNINEHGKLDVGGVVGNEGELYVVRYPIEGEPYTGRVEIYSGEIAEDFSRYFIESEQIPTAVAAGVLVDVDHTVMAAGSYIIQLLPGADDDLFTKVEQIVGRAAPISEMIMKGLTLEEIVDELLGELEPQILAQRQIHLGCNCSHEKFKVNLRYVGRQELNDIMEQDGGAEIICPYCRKKYWFPKEEILAYIQSWEDDEEEKE